MKYRFKLLLICTLLCLFWMAPVQAQEEENEGVGVLVKITPKDGHDEALLKGVEDYHHWIETWYIHNGQYAKFNKGLTRIVGTLRAGGFPHHFGFTRVASGGHGGEIQLISPVKGWAGMADEDPSFYDLMSKELGGEDEFNTFMADWGSSFKTGHNQMLKYMPEASAYGNK